MKPITKRKIEKNKFQIQPKEIKNEKLFKSEPKKVAQCCAKSSSIISGCHD